MPDELSRTQDCADQKVAIRRLSWSTAGLFGLLLVGVGGLSLAAELSGAVLAAGRIAVESSVKRLQATTGGPVDAVLVRNGDRVSAGQALVRADDYSARASHSVIAGQLAGATAQRYRLIAERDGKRTIDWPSDLAAMHPKAARMMLEEQHLLDLKLRHHQLQGERLQERIGQVRREIEAVVAQRRAKVAELELLGRERAMVADLYRRQLSPQTRMLLVEREVARFQGEIGSLDAQIPRLEGQITEMGLQSASLDGTLYLEAQKELRTLELRIDELAQRKLAAEAELDRGVLRAPSDGVVHELAVHGSGAVIRPGDTVLSIVPEKEALVAEVKIRPQDIDQVATGQEAWLRFSAFNQKTTPELNGHVVRVSPDLARERPGVENHYVAFVRVEKEQLDRLGGLKLVPGMPVEAYIRSGKRTIASYLMKPISDRMRRSLRED